MTTRTQNPSLEEFLTIIAGSRDIGLIIAKDGDELNRFARFLQEMGFGLSKNMSDLFRHRKTYFVVDESSAKDAYDFAVQYPTGQVEIFNKEQIRSEVFSPDYNNLNPVLLVARDCLNKLQANDFDLLSAVGPTFQS